MEEASRLQREADKANARATRAEQQELQLQSAKRASLEQIVELKIKVADLRTEAAQANARADAAEKALPACSQADGQADQQVEVQLRAEVTKLKSASAESAARVETLVAEQQAKLEEIEELKAARQSLQEDFAHAQEDAMEAGVRAEKLVADLQTQSQ